MIDLTNYILEATKQYRWDTNNYLLECLLTNYLFYLKLVP